MNIDAMYLGGTIHKDEGKTSTTSKKTDKDTQVFDFSEKNNDDKLVNLSKSTDKSSQNESTSTSVDALKDLNSHLIKSVVDGTIGSEESNKTLVNDVLKYALAVVKDEVKDAAKKNASEETKTSGKSAEVMGEIFDFVRQSYKDKTLDSDETKTQLVNYVAKYAFALVADEISGANKK